VSYQVNWRCKALDQAAGRVSSATIHRCRLPLWDLLANSAAEAAAAATVFPTGRRIAAPADRAVRVFYTIDEERRVVQIELGRSPAVALAYRALSAITSVTGLR